MHREFGTLSRAFRGPLANPAFNFARAVFFDHITTAYPGWTAWVTGRSSLRQADDLGLKAAAELLGLKQNSLAGHLRAGRIRGTKLRSGAKPTWLIKRTDVLAARQEQRFELPRDDAVVAAGGITLENSAIQLGISPNILRQLFEAGLLGARDVTVHFYCYLSLKRVRGILDDLEGLATSATVQKRRETSGEAVTPLKPLTWLVRVGFGPSFASVLRTVLEQRIAPDLLWPNSVGLGRFAFSDDKLRRITEAAGRGANHINQGEVMKWLRIGHNTMGKLETAGLIRSVMSPVGATCSPNTVWFERAELAQFMATHATAAELANDFDLEPWHLLRLLRARTLPTLDGRSPMNCYWKRADAARLVGVATADPGTGDPRKANMVVLNNCWTASVESQIMVESGRNKTDRSRLSH